MRISTRLAQRSAQYRRTPHHFWLANNVRSVTQEVQGQDEVVILDDHPAELRLIEEVMETAEIETTLYTVSGKEEAFDLLLPRGEYDDILRPDAILLDWNLEKGTAREVLEKVNEKQPTTTVALMTSAEPQKEKLRSVAPQADQYLTKPDSPEEYIGIINSISS